MRWLWRELKFWVWLFVSDIKGYFAVKRCQEFGHLPVEGWRITKRCRWQDGLLCNRCGEWLKTKKGNMTANQWANRLHNRVNKRKKA